MAAHLLLVRFFSIINIINRSYVKHFVQLRQNSPRIYYYLFFLKVNWYWKVLVLFVLIETSAYQSSKNSVYLSSTSLNLKKLKESRLSHMLGNWSVIFILVKYAVSFFSLIFFHSIHESSVFFNFSPRSLL